MKKHDLPTKLAITINCNTPKIPLCLACLLFITQNIFAVGNSAADELAQLLNNIHTMQATFEQSPISQNTKRPKMKTVGTVMLQRPGKFRWEITQPNNQLIIINKNEMLLYDPDLSQLIKRNMDYSKPGNPAILLGSPIETLKRSFQIVSLNQSEPGKWFKLTPKIQKNQEIGYHWVKIHFVNDQLHAMYIFNNLEQTTIITFNNIVLNTKIPPEKFTFIPPKNTDIFDSK